MRLWYDFHSRAQPVRPQDAPVYLLRICIREIWSNCVMVRDASHSLFPPIMQPSTHPLAAPAASTSTCLDDLDVAIEQLTWFARHRPELLAHATSTATPDGSSKLRTRIMGLADLLGSTAPVAAAMLQKQPALIDIESSVIRRRLDGLAKALGGRGSSSDRRTPLDQAQGVAAKMARRVPSLIASPEHEGASVLDERLTKLGSMIIKASRGAQHRSSCRDLAISLAREEPLLLVLNSSLLQDRLHALPDILGLEGGLPSAALLCIKHPFLLTVSQRSLSCKIDVLWTSLGVTKALAQRIIKDYPKVLSFSESSISSKVSALCQAFPIETVREMLCREPSLLARSTEKVLSSLSQLRALVGGSKDRAVGLAKRRPSILTKSAASQQRCYRALSVWKLTAAEKDEMVQKHPLLLSMSPLELHLRCRWLRTLITSNGYYHSGARRIPLSLLGVIIMHLPQAWSRLQYLVDVNQEPRAGLMDAVQFSGKEFEDRFPEFRKWLQFRTSEMVSLNILVMNAVHADQFTNLSDRETNLPGKQNSSEMISFP